MSRTRSLTMAVGGENCRILCPNNPHAIDALARHMSAYVTDGQPTLEFSIVWDRGMQEPLTPGWRQFKMTRTEFGFLAEGPSHWIRIPFSLDRVEALVVQYFQVSTVLRLSLATILPLKGQGFVAHAAAAGDPEGAYLFPGKSGAGKSTLVSHSLHKHCVTEETAIVRRTNGRYHVHAFPLMPWRVVQTPKTLLSSPVKRMFLLKKGRPAIREVSRSAALSYLLPNVYFALQHLDSQACALEECERFVREVPAAELTFSPDPGFWKCIEDS